MGCELIDANLVGFHFAGLEDPLRAQVEAHLADCRLCLGEYLVLKRNEELGARNEFAPAAGAKERIWATISKPPTLVWWQAGVAASVAAAVALVIGFSRGTELPELPLSRVDSSRSAAVSLNIF